MVSNDKKNFWDDIRNKTNQLKEKEFENIAKEMASRALLIVTKHEKIDNYTLEGFEVNLHINSSPTMLPTGDIKLNYRKKIS